MSIARLREAVAITPRHYDAIGLPTAYFNPGELDVLIHLIESADARTVIEFGVNSGRTAAAVLRNVPTVEAYVGVDVTPDYRTIMACQRREVLDEPGKLALADARFQLIVRARGSFDLAPQDLPRADAVFIDADHSRQGVENDYALARAVIRPGGIIIFHDDNGLDRVEVTQTLNDLVAAGADIKHVAGTWISYERY